MNTLNDIFLIIYFKYCYSYLIIIINNETERTWLFILYNMIFLKSFNDVHELQLVMKSKSLKESMIIILQLLSYCNGAVY